MRDRIYRRQIFFLDWDVAPRTMLVGAHALLCVGSAATGRGLGSVSGRPSPSGSVFLAITVMWAWWSSSWPTATAVVMEYRHRRSMLIPWHHQQDQTPPLLGWTIEERQRPIVEMTARPESDLHNGSGRYRVKVAWQDGHVEREDGCSSPPQRSAQLPRDNQSSDEEEQHRTARSTSSNQSRMIVDLCFIEKESSLASTLWPASLAGAILSCSPPIQEFVHNKAAMELGCGLGLVGQTLAGHVARSCLLTDYDTDILALVQKQSVQHKQSTSHPPIQTLPLDWRAVYDEDPPRSDLLPPNGFDMIVGTDVAYYHHLIRPLMDTTQQYLAKDRPSLCLMIGQANRVCQWELFHQIQKGGYNQYSDRVSDPWPGQTQMLLYHLYMTDWVTTMTSEPQDPPSISWETVPLEGILPIAVLVHQSPGLQLNPFSPYDLYATPELEAGLSMSF